jgi:hypothetical protein
MRKMMLLAAMVAMAALMLAAAPAMADDNDGDGRDDDFCDIFDCDEDDFCDIFDCDEDDFCDIFDCNNNNNNDDFCDVFDCRDDNNDNNNFVPAVTQDFEQEAESGDVDQSFDVSGTGDNSNQTAGIQGVANTGNAQNQIGVIDTGGFGDFDGNNDDDFCDFFDCNNNNNDEDFCDFFDCDEDDFCDFFDCDDNDRVVFVDDDEDDDGFFTINGGGLGDLEFEDVGSTIELSPTNTTSSDQQVNQAAAAFGR